MRTIYRNKTIVVPYARMTGNNHIKIFLFRDTKSSEFTFISGGCKQNEDAYVCATRELLEESKNTLDLGQLQNMTVFTFESKYRPPEHARDDAKKKINVVITRYVVYIVKTPFKTEGELLEYRAKYANSIVGNAKAFNETNDVVFATPNNMNNYNLWDFMRKEVVPQVLPYFTNGKIA